MVVIDESRWRYVLTDLVGNSFGPIFNTSGKQFSKHLNAGRTAQITINIDNPMADIVLSQDCLLKAYRRTTTQVWQRMLVGDIIHVEEDAQGDMGTVTIVAADPWWRLQHRLLGTTVDDLGRGIPFSAFSATSQGDLGITLQFILGSLNSTSYTGIIPGTNTTSTNGYVGPVYMQPVGDLFQQIVNTLGGPDFDLVPQEPSGTSMPNISIAQLNTYGPTGGNPGLCTVRPNCIFGYGTVPNNVDTYSRILSKDGLANELYSPSQGYPDLPAIGDGMARAADGISAASIGLFQDTVPNDVSSVLLRQELCNEYLAVRKSARQQITFTPSVDCNMDFGVDYDVGDIVVARAMVNGTLRYNGNVRLYGIDISVDDQDAESPVLTLIPS